jgi:capsular polysaccharide biosynthesis protein
VKRVLRVGRRVAQGIAKRATSRLKAMIPERPGTLLDVVFEENVLPRVADVLAEPAPIAPGAISQAIPETILDEPETRALLGERSGGTDVPPWAHGANGVLRSRVDLVRLPGVWHAPEYGALFNDQGQVFHKAIHEALYLTPTLGLLPGVKVEEAGAVFRAPRDVPVIDRATVFMAWGGLHNYGHFLIDCLPALMTAIDAGATERFPAIAPPLLPWHRELLDLMLGEAPRPRLVEAPLVRIEDAVFATAMDHFLHAPNAPLDQVRERILAAAAIDPTAGAKRIYISRRGSQKRVLVNELDLETALAARGFTIVKPEDLSVRDQIALFHQADLIVAPAGAALANVLFCRPEAKVIELQPSNFIGVWVRNIALLVGVDWRAFFVPSPLSETEIYLEGHHRPNAEFSWRLDLPAFLTFLDIAI